MRGFLVVICIACLGALTACSSPEERAAKAQERSYKAQEDLVKQRLAFVEQYQECVANAGGDELRIEACDSYLRSAEALK